VPRPLTSSSQNAQLLDVVRDVHNSQVEVILPVEGNLWIASANGIKAYHLNVRFVYYLHLIT
jgi:filamentous hemagglutinin family protein